MFNTFKRIFPIFSVLIVIIANSSWPQGLITSTPHERQSGISLPTKKYVIKTKIENQVAVTEVEQEFHNPHNRQVEATYIYSIPPAANLTNFSMEVEGEQVDAELLKKDEAQKIYESIVRKLRDPGILYYNGRDMIRAKIFPIEANKSKTIRLRYEEIVPYDNGVCRYQYALATEALCKKAIDYVKIEIDIESNEPLRNIYSPSHEVEIDRDSEKEAKIKYSDEGVVLDQDFLLIFSVSTNPVGINVSSFKEKGEEGFFLLLAAPSIAKKEKANPKNVIFVLDKSGSMRKDNKIEQAKEALEYCIRSLNKNDRYALVIFSDEIETLSDSLTPYKRNEIDEICREIKTIEANGGTNIDGALEQALDLMDDSEHPTYVLFLTDGQPTVGEKDAETILKHLKKWNKQKCRFFTFGVGYNVNTLLLDKIAQENKGLATYVKPNEDIEVSVSSMYSKIAEPVLADLELDFDDFDVSKLYPKDLPDLFSGSQLIVLGRYEDGGDGLVTLKGKASGETKRFREEIKLTNRSSKSDYIPRLWAARRIGHLIDEIRMHGKNKELVEEIVRLSEKYGILTEYTSFLVREAPVSAQPLTRAEQRRRHDANVSAAGDVLHKGFGLSTGRRAVSNSEVLQEQLMQAGSIASQNQARSYDDYGNKLELRIGGVRYAGNQAFFNQEQQWISTEFDANQEVIQVKPYSKAYFQLANLSTQISQIMSLGTPISFVHNNVMVQIVDDGEEELNHSQLNTLKP